MAVKETLSKAVKQVICNGNDLNVLYDTLLKTLTNDHHKELGKNALEFSKNFNWNKIIKKYIELI